MSILEFLGISVKEEQTKEVKEEINITGDGNVYFHRKINKIKKNGDKHETTRRN